MQKMSAHAQTEQTDDNELKTRENNLDTPRENTRRGNILLILHMAHEEIWKRFLRKIMIAEKYGF